MARRLTAMSLLLLVGFVLILWLTPVKPPSNIRLLTLLWAASHKPVFYLLAGLFGAAAPLSLVAWRRQGEHRLWLIGGWVLFATISAGRFGNELATLLQVIWWRITG